jgi:pyruvate dehydrogenase E1 component alpha subunit
LPIIYLCENNQYGEHTAYESVTGVKNIADRGPGFGIESHIMEGSDVLEVYGVVSSAVAKARAGKGPTLLEAKTYRYRGHHVGDSGYYRTDDEVKWWMENKDPIKLLGDHMIAEKVATKEELDALGETVDEEVEEAVEFGREASVPAPEQAYEDLYA